MTSKPTIHIVDDDEAVRRAVARLLRAAGFGIAVYKNAGALLSAAPRLSPGCMLLALRMSGMGGMELLAWMRKFRIDLPIIVLTSHGDVQTAVNAMKAGAVDVIEKPADELRLLATIEDALDKEKHPAAHNSAVAWATEQMDLLSPRERQILEAIALGRPNKLIAYDLGISVRTVEAHRAHLLVRLRVRNIAEAIRIAVLADLTKLA